MKFNLNEIFDIAVSIEQSGFHFYSKAAKKLPDFEDFFNYLANEEVGHENTFQHIKVESIPKSELDSIYDPDNIIEAYMGSLTDSMIFNNKDEIEELFKSAFTIEKVIDWAIKREHDTILFFIGLKSTLETDNEKNIVERIISEEINHVHILMNKKSSLN